MTGEITLRSEVLGIGGLKEKLLADHRGGIKVVMVPEANVKDLADIPVNVKHYLEIIPVRCINWALQLALQTLPTMLYDDAHSTRDASAGRTGKPTQSLGKTNKYL